MANDVLDKNTTTGDHTGHWTATATKSGTYEFDTAGTFVDRDIDLVVPQADVSVSADASATVGVSIGTKSGTSYPFTGTGTIRGTATATVNTRGFTDETSYTGTSFSGTASVTGGVREIKLGVRPSQMTHIIINSVTVGDKTDSTYAISGSVQDSTSAEAYVATSGYGTQNTETGSGTIPITAQVSATIPAGSASATLSATATKPTIAKESTTNVLSSAITTTKPSGYFVGVKATAPATTLSGTPTVTEGYIKDANDISVSGSTSSSTGNAYYVPITASSLGSTAKTGVTYAENTTVTIPSKGALYIEGGYIPPTMITLDQMLDGKTDTAGTAQEHILSGYVAYTVDGEKLTGTMANNAALSETITSQGGSISIAEGYYPAGGTVTATLPTQTLPTATVSSSSATLKATVSRSTSDQYIEIPTGYNDTKAAYKISATPNAGALTSAPVANSTDAVTVGTTATSGYYTVSAKVNTTANVASAGYIAAGSKTTTATANTNVGKIAQSTLKVDGTTFDPANKLGLGKTLVIAAGYYPSARNVTAYLPASKALTGSLTAVSDTGYDNPTLVTTKTTGESYVTITGSASGLNTGDMYNGTTTADVKYLKVFTGSYSIV